jgi:hypothetical protein
MSFLRYVKGSIPGKKFKRPASADERQVPKKKYDKESRERKFLLIILVWLTTFVLFDSIKFELICSFDKHAVNFMISAPVAEHQY